MSRLVSFRIVPFSFFSSFYLFKQYSEMCREPASFVSLMALYVFAAETLASYEMIFSRVRFFPGW